MLDAVQQAELGAFVERAGLRNVDLIVPAEDKSPAEYLAQSLQGIAPAGARSTGSMWAAAFQFDGSQVTLRAAAPSPSGMVLPPDFNALPLAKPAVMVEAEKMVQTERQIGFIDTDCTKEVGRVFGSSDLMNIYTEMQKLTSRTFKAALSPVAEGEWI